MVDSHIRKANMTPESDEPCSSLLELAANNDLHSFQALVERDPSLVDRVGLWYCRQKASSQMALHRLTPFMVASIYGSLDILKAIISFPEIDVNQSSGPDKSTALHCAASGGSHNLVEAVKLLLSAGADPNLTDANGLRPIDVLFVCPNFRATKQTLQTLLATEEDSNSNLVPILKKEYPPDPTLPDIKNSLYSTDEFRMFSFKVRPCSRAYSHDWTECPFVHPGENARRRDPRKFHYSCVPCPDFRKGACRRGDMCEYAHGVFECWLHPAQYRTRLCKDGPTCSRRVCFFAHVHEELRPLYVSTGSAVPSPSFTPPMSPLANINNSLQSSRLRSSLNARDLDIFSAEGSSSNSPRFQQGTLSSPIKASFSPRNMDYSQPISPISARISMLTQHERFRSLSSNALLDENWSKWGPHGGPAEWGITDDDELGSSFENVNDGEEPDLSWVQSLVKESPQDVKEKYGDVGDGAIIGEGVEDQSVLGAWLEQMQLDQLMAQ